MIEQLNQRFGIDKALRFDIGQGGLPRCVVESETCHGEVYLLGAHVTHFEPRGQRPVLYVSPRSNYVEGKAIRGGIPICFPWFGPRDPAQPKENLHGFVRTRPWTLRDTGRSGDAIFVRFAFESDESTRALWPHDFTATLSVSFGLELKIELAATNLSPQPLEITQALHSYFAVSDVRNVSVEGLLNVEYHDKAAGAIAKQVDPLVRFNGEVDRVYRPAKGRCVLHDPAWKRRIIIEKQGSDATVVWNPHSALAAKMPDVGEDVWPHFCCIETAIAAPNPARLEPGGTMVMAAIHRVEEEK